MCYDTILYVIITILYVIITILYVIITILYVIITIIICYVKYFFLLLSLQSAKGYTHPQYRQDPADRRLQCSDMRGK